MLYLQQEILLASWDILYSGSSFTMYDTLCCELTFSSVGCFMLRNEIEN